AGGVERGASGGPLAAAARRRPRGPVRCRVCGATLTEAGAMKLLRCEDCPSDMDEGLYERLHAWREERARALGQPAYCVFTEKTLMAIAERVPATGGELAVIAGVGARKLDRFGAEVLSICAGEEGVTGAEDD
ncbi:HRDC domain-containing protein, partial [Streptomyces hydrogenans]